MEGAGGFDGSMFTILIMKNEKLGRLSKKADYQKTKLKIILEKPTVV